MKKKFLIILLLILTPIIALSEEPPTEFVIAEAIENQDHAGLSEALDGISWAEYPQNAPVDLLTFAASIGNIQAIDALVETGIDINSKMEGGWTALSVSLMAEQIEAAQYMLSIGADPTITSDDGVSPIDIAASMGMSQFGKPDATEDNVSKEGELSVDDHLVSAILDGDDQSLFGSIQAGADPNHVTGDGWPVIVLAVAEQNNEAVDTLLEMGAKTNVANTEGLTPLIATILNSDHSSLEKLVALEQTNLDFRSMPGAPRPIHVAIWEKDMEAISILVSNGTDLSKVGEESLAPEDLAIEEGFHQALPFLKQQTDSSELRSIRNYVVHGENDTEAKSHLINFSESHQAEPVEPSFFLDPIWLGMSLVEIAAMDPETNFWPEKPQNVSERVRISAEQLGLLSDQFAIRDRAANLIFDVGSLQAKNGGLNFLLDELIDRPTQAEAFEAYRSFAVSRIAEKLKNEEQKSWQFRASFADDLFGAGLLLGFDTVPEKEIVTGHDFTVISKTVFELVEKDDCATASAIAGSYFSQFPGGKGLEAVSYFEAFDKTNVLWALFLLCEEQDVLDFLWWYGWTYYFSDYFENGRLIGSTMDSILIKEKVSLFDAAMVAGYDRLAAHIPRPGQSSISTRGNKKTEVVSKIQRMLKDRGYYSGKIDGSWGEGSQDASVALCNHYFNTSIKAAFSGGITGLCGDDWDCAHEYGKDYANFVRAKSVVGGTLDWGFRADYKPNSSGPPKKFDFCQVTIFSDPESHWEVFELVGANRNPRVQIGSWGKSETQKVSLK